MLKIKKIIPSLVLPFNRCHSNIKRWEEDANSNCYTYALNNFALDEVYIGGLTKCDGFVNRELWMNERGLDKCMYSDGWEKISKKDISQSMHIIAVFGVQMTWDYPNFHVLRMDDNYSFSAKSGRGKSRVFTGRDIGKKITMNPDNIECEIKDIVSIDSGGASRAIFSGFWKMPDKGLLVHPMHFNKKTALQI